MEISEVVRILLKKRGVESEKDISAFLEPNYADLHNPMLLIGMEKAVARVFDAIDRGERIVVYADFDCDGIPGAAVLLDFFKKIGHQNVEVYVPHRDREGYGFHKDAIDALSSRGVSLIITVDVGTTAVESIRHAKDKKIDVIVTDHHEIPGSLPDAFAILNPKRGDYPFPHLCGAGVAFKLVQALLTEGHRRADSNFSHIPPGWEKWLLDLVGIATVADMVPLVGENRILAYYGVTVLRKSRRPGIVALCNRLRLRQAQITEDDIGFSFAPRINAASRMGDPDLALRLLTTTDSNEADQLAAHLERLNTSRKGVVGSVVREARRRVKERFGEDEKVIVLGDTEWKPALLGLAANSIVGDRGGVVCLWGRDALGRLKGSCRSDGSVSVVEMFSNASDAVIEFGGHAASGGFSVSHEHVHALQEKLSRSVEALAATLTPQSVPEPDLNLALSQISMPLFQDVSRLAPFGIGNMKPVLHISEVTVSSVRRFGKEQNHVEIQVACQQTGASFRAYDFFKSPEGFTHHPSPGKNANLLVSLEKDSFRGGFALRLIDVHAV